MTIREAIMELERQQVMKAVLPASAEAIQMAISALEKETQLEQKESQSEQANKNSSSEDIYKHNINLVNMKNARDEFINGLYNIVEPNNIPELIDLYDMLSTKYNLGDTIIARLDEAHIDLYKPGDYKYNNGVDAAIRIILDSNRF